MKGRCALSLGYLSLGDPSFPMKHSVLEGLFEGREEKAIDLQFTIGEALACTTAGALSSVSVDPWRLPPIEDRRYVNISVCVSLNYLSFMHLQSTLLLLTCM